MSEPVFRLFVYGTLKRGYWNHERFCRDAISIETASLPGRLYKLPSGIPVLAIPAESIIATGSDDPLSDAHTQSAADECGGAPIEHGGQWRWIEGEIICLPDPHRTVPPIDRLEGYNPGGFSSYRRVLVRTQASDGGGASAWCYVATQALLCTAIPLSQHIWP